MKHWNAPMIEELNIQETAHNYGHDNHHGSHHDNKNEHPGNHIPDHSPKPPCTDDGNTDIFS